MQDRRDRSRQRRLAMIHVTNRPNIHVRLASIEFLLGHCLSGLEPTTGIEPVTPSLPRKCSTTEPRGRIPVRTIDFWSGKRDSNPRPSAWKADALATELLPRFFLCPLSRSPDTAFGGERRVRTSVGVRRQIYSLLPLATRASPHCPVEQSATNRSSRGTNQITGWTFGRPPSVDFPRTSTRPWSWRRDLNPRPADYKSAALPPELRQLGETLMLYRPGVQVKGSLGIFSRGAA